MSQYIFPFIVGVIKLVWWIMAGAVELAILLYQVIMWRVVAIPIAAILFLSRLIIKILVGLDKLVIRYLISPLHFVYTCGLPESGTLKTWVTTDIKSRKKTIKDYGERNKDPALKKKWSGHTVPAMVVFSLISMFLYYGINTIFGPPDPTNIQRSLEGDIFYSLFIGLAATVFIFIAVEQSDSFDDTWGCLLAK